MTIKVVSQSNYHPEWLVSRINFVLKRYPEEYFKGKRILELGSYHGDVGNVFQTLGADVLSVEGKWSNIERSNAIYPNLKVVQANLSTAEWPWGKFDVIINWGLLYHLDGYHREHLINCIDNCDLLLLESVIYDSAKPVVAFRKEVGPDQSLTEYAGHPSTSFIENIFIEKCVTFTRYSDPSLNGGMHHYDWVDTGNDVMHDTNRRFWIAIP